MSDVKDRADEMEKEDKEHEAELPSHDTATNDDEVPSKEPADGETDAEEAPDLPEGINLIQALIEAQQDAQTNKDGWQRARAEFANYKKRIERERSELFQRASIDTLRALLPIIDDFDRAFESVPEDINENPWIGGVSMIQRKFITLLEHYEVEAIDPTGEPFDPNMHQAIGTEDSDKVESGHVTETLQKGYRAGDNVLRLALVKVAS